MAGAEGARPSPRLRQRCQTDDEAPPRGEDRQCPRRDSRWRGGRRRGPSVLRRARGGRSGGAFRWPKACGGTVALSSRQGLPRPDNPHGWYPRKNRQGRGSQGSDRFRSDRQAGCCGDAWSDDAPGSEDWRRCGELRDGSTGPVLNDTKRTPARTPSRGSDSRGSSRPAPARSTGRPAASPPRT